jgi:hypothetical protein
MAEEYRVAYRRKGGRTQYRTFQQRRNFVAFATALMKQERTDLQPLEHVAFLNRSVGSWREYREVENLSYPAGMIKGPTE